jgi:hypothetical protein
MRGMPSSLGKRQSRTVRVKDILNAKRIVDSNDKSVADRRIAREKKLKTEKKGE